jgi:hypothetical protein
VSNEEGLRLIKAGQAERVAAGKPKCKPKGDDQKEG